MARLPYSEQARIAMIKASRARQCERDVLAPSRYDELRELRMQGAPMTTSGFGWAKRYAAHNRPGDAYLWED